MGSFASAQLEQACIGKKMQRKITPTYTPQAEGSLPRHQSKENQTQLTQG